jgi:hypothetical protein
LGDRQLVLTLDKHLTNGCKIRITGSQSHQAHTSQPSVYKPPTKQSTRGHNKHATSEASKIRDALDTLSEQSTNYRTGRFNHPGYPAPSRNDHAATTPNDPEAI